MKKELISGFVDSELNEKELQQIESGDRHELKEAVNVYRVIGECIRHNQLKIQTSDQFQGRLKDALQQEYSSQQSALEKNRDSSADSASRVESAQEESVA